MSDMIKRFIFERVSENIITKPYRRFLEQKKTTAKK